MKSINFAVLFGALTIVGTLNSPAAGETKTANPPPKTAVLYGFANVTDISTLPEGLAKETCSHHAASAVAGSGAESKASTQDETTQLANTVTEELTKRLSKKMSVTVAHPGDIPPVGSLVISGCFLSADRGHAAERLAGMGLGASHLSAHVRLFYAGVSTPVPFDEFNLSVKGSKRLPPIGPVGLGINAVSEKRETLQADAKRLADNILKRLKKDLETTATGK